MRLIRLQFEGIGSFADPMEIDFAALGGAGLFLIEGPTGAGKSTILDAIVFALYGSPAGSESDPGRLDSHLRDSNRQPFVELDFASGGATYRIRRTPKHERDKKRGTGMKVDEGGVSLVRLAPDPASISHKAKEVGDWVIEHVGLSKQQFASTIVLAQGEFAAFLNAETRERTPILEKVFGTEFYQDVERQLTLMRRDALAARTQAQARLTEAVDRCLGLMTLDPDGDPVAAIDEELARLHERSEQAGIRSESCAAALGAAEDQLAAAREFDAKQQSKRALQQRNEELDRRSSGIEALRAALAGHDRALPVMASLKAWRAADHDVGSAKTRAEQQQAALVALGEESASTQRLHEVAALRGELLHPADLELQLPQLQREAERLVTEVTRRSQTVEQLGAQRELTAARIAADQQAAERPVGEADRLAALEVARAELAEQLTVGEQISVEVAALAQAQEQLVEAQADLDAVVGHLEGARIAQLANLAGALAAGLVDGEPCTVCGSVDHPAPARQAVDTTADIAGLEVLAQQRQAAVLEARTLRDRLDEKLRMLRTAMTVDPERASARLRDVEDEVTALRAAVAEAEEARVRHREGQTRLRELDEHLTQARIQAEQQQAALLAAQEKVQTAEMAVSAARDGHPSVAARLQALAARQQALVMARAAEDELSHARRAARQTESILADTLAGVGLPDAQAAEAAILDESVADEYQKTVDQFDAEMRTVAGALQDLVGIDLEVAPDLQALEHAVDERRMASEAAQKELGRLQHTLGEAVPLREHVRARAQEHNRVRDETAGVIRMADLATASRGEGIHRVKLSAFVLMRRFESVVEAANDRLDAISDGRYQLKVEHKGLDNRGQHGLDLVVEDQRTERCRPTKSLSGGESFYVSLALALGLADVVRSESGGVSLGTLFIDEGFGSLDSEVLEEVIDMLEQVRAGEDRVIGLVSHVEILKQRIDPRISVRRDPQRAGVSTLEVSV